MLCIDLDPQGNLTMSQGIDPDKVEKTMYDVLVNDMPISRGDPAQREIDIAVASIDLAGAEIAMSTKIGRERSLEKALSEVVGDYDFICIDTPPSLGLLTINALTAADKVIVPVQCEYLSMRGLVQLQNTLEMIQENLNPGVEIEGILPTMLDARTVHAKEAVEILEENFGELVFKSRIRKAIKFAEAPVRGLQRAQVRSEGQRGRVLPGAGEGGFDEWRVVSGPACARVRWRTSSAPPSRAGGGARDRAAAGRPLRRPASREDSDSATTPETSRPSSPSRGPAGPGAGPRLPGRGAARGRGTPGAEGAAEPDLQRGALTTEDPPSDRERSYLDAARAAAPPPTRDQRVVGVGGAGVNAVNRMVEADIPGVEFMAINTDLQSLQQSSADVTVHLGSGVARGLGAGSDPELGYQRGLRGAGQDQAPAEGLGHGLHHRRRRRRDGDRRRAGDRPAGARRRAR